MERICYSCKEIIEIGSLKTSRLRLKPMGLIPPEGMSAFDRICNKCLQKMYDKQIKHVSIKRMKKNMADDLLRKRRTDITTIPKKVGFEKKKKFLL